MNVCGEISYKGIHSDICLSHDADNFSVPQDYREFVHACLDEWLNNSNGTGAFWIGDPTYFQQED